MRDYAELISDLRRHYCDAKEDDTQEVCEECAYDVIVSDNSKFSGITDVCTCGLMHRAADAIEELLDELTTIRKQLPHWISVEERLPEGNGTRYEYDLEESNLVLVYGINHIGEMAYGLGRYIYDHDDPKDSGWNGNMDCDYDLDYCTVTHWMPLPAPPKED